MRKIANNIARKILEALLNDTDIKINGTRPWDIKVHDPNAYARILLGGSLALGEAYMQGLWDSEQLDKTLTLLLSARLDETMPSIPAAILKLRSKLLNLQTAARSRNVVGNYELGNDFYEMVLDPRMQYTCGYWKDAKTLEQAQEAKLELICRKLKLEQGMRILELGSGWGGFAEHAAREYGCEVTAYNIAPGQVRYARERCKDLPVVIREADYREAAKQAKKEGRFDRVASMGLCEHVGYKNHRTLMEVVDTCLTDEGLFLLHTIGKDVSVHHTDPWLQKYIFPNTVIPSANQLTRAAEGLLIIEDWHNFGPDYDKTLQAWYNNFIDHWETIKELDCVKQASDGDLQQFKRMWTYYLSSAAASFRARRNQLWHIVFSKGHLGEEYRSVR